MARAAPALVTFNRGVISPDALARTDIDRVAASAETQTNFFPKQLGPMMFRPGTEYLKRTEDLSDESYIIPFVFATDDTAIIELGGDRCKISDADGNILTNDAGAAAVVLDPDFTNSPVAWINISDVGGNVLVAPGVTNEEFPALTLSSSEFGLYGNRYSAGRIQQNVTVPANVRKTLRIRVSKNYEPVTFYVSNNSSLTPNVVGKYTLGPGEHLIRFSSSVTTVALIFEYFGDGLAVVDYCQFLENSSNSEFEIDLGDIGIDCGIAPRSMRHVQSGDIVYVSNIGDYDEDKIFAQGRTLPPPDKGILFKIERRPNDSWSVVHYQPRNGPFQLINTSSVTLSVAAGPNPGTVYVTPSAQIFKENLIGSLIRVESIGQLVTTDASADGQFASEIRVTGVGTGRLFNISITGVWTGTVTLQRSVGVTGAWTNVATYTGNTTTTLNDGFDNSIIFYRLGFDTGGWASGTATVTLSIDSGSIVGVGRVVWVDTVSGVSSNLRAVCVILKAFGPGDATETWSLGSWSYPNGFPSAPELFEGRLWWVGQDRLYGSVSDNFESYDDLVEGDSGPIQRSIAYGPVEKLRWVKGAQRLYLGGQTAEHVVKSSSFDEPLTPADLSIRQTSNAGSCDTDALLLDGGILFGQRGGRRLYELTITENSVESQNQDLSLLCPEVLSGRIKSMAVQRTPETRVFCVLEDGKIAMLVYNRIEDLRGWVPMELNSRFKAVQVFVLPSDDEDRVYFQVEVIDPGRSDDGFHYILRLAKESDCVGGSLHFQLDAFQYSNSAPVTSISYSCGYSGQTVLGWGDGQYLGELVVDGSGQVQLGGTYTSVVVGVGYTGQYKSSKLAYAAKPGYTALLQPKRVTHLGLMMRNVMTEGLKYGPEFTRLDDMPLVDDEVGTIPAMYTELDRENMPFNGEWDTDSRICLQITAPYIATVQAITFVIETEEKE